MMDRPYKRGDLVQVTDKRSPYYWQFAELQYRRTRMIWAAEVHAGHTVTQTDLSTDCIRLVESADERQRHIEDWTPAWAIKGQTEPNLDTKWPKFVVIPKASKTVTGFFFGPMSIERARLEYEAAGWRVTVLSTGFPFRYTLVLDRPERLMEVDS